MAELPDLYSWIKLLDGKTDKVLDDGSDLEPPREVLVRYSIANDSHKPAGPLWIVGALHRNGVRVASPGNPNVVPAQTITVQPGEVWSREYLVFEPEDSSYKAALLADVGNIQKEEDETNNVARAAFAFTTQPR